MPMSGPYQPGCGPEPNPAPNPAGAPTTILAIGSIGPMRMVRPVGDARGLAWAHFALGHRRLASPVMATVGIPHGTHQPAFHLALVLLRWPKHTCTQNCQCDSPGRHWYRFYVDHHFYPKGQRQFQSRMVKV